MGNGAGKISEHDAEKIAGNLFSHAKFDAIKNPTDGMVHLPLTPEQLKVFQDSAGLRAAANSCSRSGNGVHSEDHLKLKEVVPVEMWMSHAYENSNPFLSFEEHSSASIDEEEHERHDAHGNNRYPVDWHPHMGMCVLTYVQDGVGRFADSLGNAFEVQAPGVAWWHCGSGLEHAQGGGTPRGQRERLFEVWVNTPYRDRYADPSGSWASAGDLEHPFREGKDKDKEDSKTKNKDARPGLSRAKSTFLPAVNAITASRKIAGSFREPPSLPNKIQEEDEDEEKGSEKKSDEGKGLAQKSSALLPSSSQAPQSSPLGLGQGASNNKNALLPMIPRWDLGKVDGRPMGEARLVCGTLPNPASGSWENSSSLSGKIKKGRILRGPARTHQPVLMMEFKLDISGKAIQELPELYDYCGVYRFSDNPDEPLATVNGANVPLGCVAVLDASLKSPSEEGEGNGGEEGNGSGRIVEMEAGLLGARFLLIAGRTIDHSPREDEVLASMLANSVVDDDGSTEGHADGGEHGDKSNREGHPVENNSSAAAADGHGNGNGNESKVNQSSNSATNNNGSSSSVNVDSDTSYGEGSFAWHGSMVADSDADVEEALWEYAHGVLPSFRVAWDYRHSTQRPLLPPEGYATLEDVQPRMVYPPDPPQEDDDGDDSDDGGD